MVELEEIDQDVEKTMSGLLSYLIPNIDFLCSILYSKSVSSPLETFRRLSILLINNCVL